MPNSRCVENPTMCCCSLRQAVEGTVRIAGGLARLGLAECRTKGGLRDSKVWRWAGTGIVRRRWKNEGISVVSRRSTGVARWLCLSSGGEYDFSEVARGSADRGGIDWGVRARKARRRRRGVGAARGEVIGER